MAWGATNIERLANEAGELAARISRIESFNSIMASTRAARDVMKEAHHYYMIDKDNNVRPGNVWQIE
jgi:hypothetical protein